MCIISNPFVNSNWSYNSTRSIRVEIGNFFVLCDLEIWQMTLKTIRAPILHQALCIISNLWVNLNSNYSLQTRNSGKNRWPVWPWYLMNDLEKQRGTSSILCQAFCTIAKPSVNSNFSYSTETTKLGFDLCGLDLWPLPFACTSLLSLGIAPENFMTIRWEEHCERCVTDGRTDRQAGGRTNGSVLRAAWSQLKIIQEKNQNVACKAVALLFPPQCVNCGLCQWTESLGLRWVSLITLWDRMIHIFVSKLGQHWFR